MVPELTRVPGGYLLKAEAGYQLHVRPQRLFRLVEVPESDLRDQGRFWCYATFEAAVLAGIAWSIGEDTEPVGFIRAGGARSQA